MPSVECLCLSCCGKSFRPLYRTGGWLKFDPCLDLSFSSQEVEDSKLPMSLDVPMPRIVHPDIGKQSLGLNKLRTPKVKKAQGEGSNPVLRWGEGGCPLDTEAGG